MKKSVAVLAVAVLAGTMGAALAGPAGAKGGGGTKTTTVRKVTKCVTKTAVAGITQAMNAFLSGDPTIAMKYVDQGAKIGASYQLSEQLDTAAGLTSATKLTLPINVKATCTGSTKANFTYDLYMKDKTTATTTAPLGLNEAGNALIKKGVWYISATTVCDLENGAGSVAAQATNMCYTAIGESVPSAS
jgi:hypothetical protein